MDQDEIERGSRLAPRFGADGLIPAVATDAETGKVLMQAYMNEDALHETLRTGYAHYFSRSRQSLWKKGATSGELQEVVEARIDCDQDAVWLRVRQQGRRLLPCRLSDLFLPPHRAG